MGCKDIVEVAHMLDATEHVGLGWVGGVGCNDIVEVAHMLDATEHVGLGWVGGVGCNDIVEVAHMLDVPLIVFVFGELSSPDIFCHFGCTHNGSGE